MRVQGNADINEGGQSCLPLKASAGRKASAPVLDLAALASAQVETEARETNKAMKKFLDMIRI